MTAPSPSNSQVDKLFLQHAASLRGFVFGLVGERAAADDLFQEVFLTVVRRADDFQPDGDFLAWARGIARNKALEHFRRRRTAPVPFDASLVELLAEAAETSDHRDPPREALARCLDRLAPRAREIVDLRYAEQALRPPEIAERIGWTVNAVHVTLARARKFLRECVQGTLAAGDAS